MRYKPLTTLCGVLLSTAAAFVMVGCNGKTGAAGANGTNGTNGNNGAYALDATTLSQDEWSALSLSVNVTKAAVSAGKPSVDFTVMDQHNTPLKGLGFNGKSATDAYPVYLNMGFSIAKLIPEANGSPSKWVSYIVTTNPTAAAPTTFNPSKPTTDSIGSLVDHGDGSYTYTFRRDISQTKAQLDAYTYTGNNVEADLGDVTYDGTLTHRLTVYVGGSAWGTGSNTADRSNTGLPSVPVKFPANVAYDFIPSTGAPIAGTNARRDIVDVTSCFQCHAKFEFHGEGRQDTRYCVVCHNDQRKYGNAEATTTASGYSGSTYKIAGRAVGDFPAFIHRLHMGEELTKTGYNYANILFNEVTYPQDQRNCVKCHSASATTPQGDNWFMKPNRMACGACHDTIDWTQPHGGATPIVRTDDSACASCHDQADIKFNHVPVVPPNPLNIWNTNGTNNNTNASYVAAFPGNLPAGAHKVTYDLKSVVVNASRNPEITFRFLLDGAPVTFNTYAAGVKEEMMDGFVGSPSVYVAWGVPQDGVATPADWNASSSTYIKNIWRGDGKDMTGAALSAAAVATLGAKDANGYYKLTMTGTFIPTTATQVTGGIGYTYGLTTTQPLTQIDLAAYPYTNPSLNTAAVGAGAPKNQGGLSVPAPNTWKVISALPAGFPANAGSTTVGPANTPRRTIVANANCNNCHGAMGVFTSEAFHAGQRNDPQTCEFCHNGSRVNSGWGVNMKDFVHAIHGASKRVNKFSWEFQGTGAKYWAITYPSILNNCEACHLPGTYDFGRTANAAATPNLLWTTVATGAVPNPVGVVTTGNEVNTANPWWSQASIDVAAASNGGVAPGYNFGANFAFNANTNATTQPALTTLVKSPYVAACSACHDSPMALNHMKVNGGAYYATRASQMATPVLGGTLVNQEQCFLCHSAGKVADTQLVHMNFK